MNFLYSEYLILILLGFACFVYFSLKQENRFFKWVKDHWFYERSLKNRLSGILFFFGILFLSLALLDLRGPEKSITGKISDQKTILLIDSSASMLAEDVRPNRFKKAIILAKHYVKKAVGQQISIVVFSDSAKQIIPFTNDVDLMEARLGALEKMQLKRGGTSLTLGIKESIQYFENHSEDVTGNILLFTDAEETDGGIDIELPEGLTVGVIGVGTAKGSTIPMRNKNGNFIGNKKYKGEAVISKLDESFIKSLGDKIKDFKYWIATSYTLPTEKIIDFFSDIHKVKQSKNNFRIRPVLSNYLLVPGVVFLIISFLLKNFKTFILPLLLFSTISFSVEKDTKEPKKEKSEMVITLENKFKKGDITKTEKKALASLLLKEGFAKESESLYQEITTKKINKQNTYDHFNLGAAQFKNKKIKEGFESYKKLHDYLEMNDPESELLPTIKKNMLKALEQMSSESKSKSKSKDDKNEDEKNEKKDQNNSKKGDSKDKKDKKDEPKDNKNKDEKNENKKDKKNGKNKSDDKEKKKPKNKSKRKGDKPSDQKGERGKKKMPAILKQLMSDDNKLQKKMIDTGTTKRKPREKKDW